MDAVTVEGWVAAPIGQAIGWCTLRLSPWIGVEKQYKGWWLLDSSHSHQGKRNSYRSVSLPPFTFL